MKQRPQSPTSAAKPSPVSPGVALAAAPPDTTPPSKPATPTIDTIIPIVATIRPTGSFDNDAVAGYSALRLLNGVWNQWAFTNIDVDTIYLRDLSPGTTYIVAAGAPLPSNFTFNSPAFGTISCAMS